MYINGVASYLPSRVIPNAHFLERCGVSSDWIRERSGIEERRRCADHEDTHSMGLAAVRNLLGGTDTPAFDLIVGATYTPADTVVTLAHTIQHHLDLPDIPTLNVTTACSSVLNAIEIVECYFAANKATRALVVGSEHNSAYQDDTDPQSGPLWGDGAVAFDISKHELDRSKLQVLHIKTAGAATVGRATEAVFLKPRQKGIPMVHGADVFTQACFHMEREVRRALDKHNLGVTDLAFVIPHQANKRISLRLQKALHLPTEKLVSNVERYGNTGCCGFGIGLAETVPRLQPQDRVMSVVFGGGYSCGSMLMQTLH